MVFTQGAREKFAYVVQAHLDDAYRLASRMVGAGEAEDVVQDAAIRALQALDGASLVNPRAWFLAIVRNCALTALGRRGPLVAGSDGLDAIEDEILDPNADIEAEVIARQDAKTVRAAIDALPIALRETLVLRDMNDLSYRDIAEATKSPIGTVMSRLARARAALAKSLGKRL